MFVLVRALTYASLFIGFLLVFLPGQLLARFGVPAPERIGSTEIAGAVLAISGFAIAVACILTFVFVGRGTPAPFDPPRRLVVRGPYRMVRNPMYVGAGLALVGAAIFYRSWAVLAYATLFLLVMHLFVVMYEEPTLRSTFGEDYDVYRTTGGRWWPRGLRGGLVASLLITATIGGLVIALANAPLYRWLNAAECREAYAHARTRADTARVDLRPYRKAHVVAKAYCGEVRAARIDSASRVIGLAESPNE
jgi:protein-S-isoprenylcysteine O-methyltransferase Ste14